MLINRTKQKGFTLIEMIGVLAVIAILAAIVAPKIFDAIRDAKIDTLVTNLNSVRTSIVQYYKDTSAFPQHDADPSGIRGQGAIKDFFTQPTVTDAAGNTAPQRGWQGPYIDKELENPINPSGDFTILDTAAAVVAGPGQPVAPVEFDLDGNGIPEYSTVANAAGRVFVISYAQITGLTVDEARKLSEILDSDLGAIGATDAWWLAGRARTPVGSGSPLAIPGAGVEMWVYLGSR